MRVFISADMEGATGVAVGPQVGGDAAEYTRFRKLLTQDINAAVRGAAAAGATECVVADAHGKMTNVLIEELDSRARLISGSNRQLLQVEGVGPGFAAAMFVAYHAREGAADAVLSHTLLGGTVLEVRCNGRPFGETALNAAVAGHFGVPVCLVAGDDQVCREAREYLGDIEVAEVKIALERLAANSLPPARSHALIESRAQAGLERALRGEIRPFVVPGPVSFEADFKATSGLKMACLFPEVQYVGPRTLRVSGADYLAAYKILLGTLFMVRAAQSGIIS